MSAAEGKKEKKARYFKKVEELVATYNKLLIVGANNVGSRQMQNIRKALRGQAVILMGKNTMVRKAIRSSIKSDPKLEALLPLIVGNIGFVLTNGDLNKVRDSLLAEKVGAPAKAGTLAPNDVFIQPGPTGMEPTQTAFFQALNIATKINKGQIEILAQVHLVKKGEKVGASEATLLAKLDIKPFTYGLTVQNVYDNGSIYDPAVLDLTDDELLNRFRKGVSNIAALSLQIGYPTVAAVPHVIANAYKNVLAIAVETDYSFKQAEQIKAFLKDPSAFAAAAAPAPAAAAPAAAGKKEEPKKEEKEEKSDDDMGFGLFD
jgi:large subunit ribosomal protein LP0